MVGSVANHGACNGTKDDLEFGPFVGKITGDNIVIDLSTKGGPKDLTGTWSPSTKRIVFTDG